MQQEWRESRDAENSVGIAVEDVAIKRTFDRWRELPNLIGGVLYAGGKMVAYTVGERLDDDTRYTSRRVSVSIRECIKRSIISSS